MDGYSYGSHSKYSINVHLIFVTKYRKKIFRLIKVSDDVKQFLHDVSQKHGYKTIQMESDLDHVHILLDYMPNTSVYNIVKQLKQYSTYQMWKYHREYLFKHYWKREVFWSDGYFACSIGKISQEIIEKYIQTQG